MAAGLTSIVDIIVYTLTLVLIIHALMSFAPLEPWHPLRRAIAQIAEPILQPFRGLIPPVGMFDFSIMVALIAIQLLGELIKLLIRSAF